MIDHLSTISHLLPLHEAAPCVSVIHALPAWDVVFMNTRGCMLLDVSLAELQSMSAAEYQRRFFNPGEFQDYVDKVMTLLQGNNDKEYITFFQQVRTMPLWNRSFWLSSLQVLQRNEAKQPLLTLTITIPVEAGHTMIANIERLLDENNFLRNNTHRYSSLTSREKQILVLVAQNIPVADISRDLHLSEETLKTHRRNIKRKIHAQNHYDIVRFAQAFGLI